MLDNKNIENLNKLKLTYCMDIERILLDQDLSIKMANYFKKNIK